MTKLGILENSIETIRINNRVFLIETVFQPPLFRVTLNTHPTV
ncbi:MAG: hypothetical protein QXP72_02565 [Desulfurococcaceae archaeon]